MRLIKIKICDGQTPFLQTGIKGHSGKELHLSQELEVDK